MNKRLVQVLLLVSALVLPAGELAAATYYVDRNHAAASDSNVGSDTSPWKTIVHAAAIAQAGDTVYIKAGTYKDGNVKVRHSGSPGNPITFAAFPGDERQAIIKGATFISHGNDFITVSGLKIMDSPRHGFLFIGRQDPAPPAEGIIISGNYTHNTCNAGIAIKGVLWSKDPGDYDNIRDVEIANNLVELATNSQLATSANKCRGEVISVSNGVVNVNVHDNEIRLGDPNMVGGDEGIDFKEGVRDSSIYHNYIHDLSDKAIYLDGGSANPAICPTCDPQVTNIHIYDNVMARLPSNGISVTTEGQGDVDGVYIYNNIAFDVDGDGFLVYNHPGGATDGGTVNNVYLIHNTATRSKRRGFSVDHETATGILFQNNIAWANVGTHDFYSKNLAGPTYLSNLCIKDPGKCIIQADPQFSDAANNDFSLAATSPAIDVATTIDPALLAAGIGTADIVGTARPEGTVSDIGAHEYSGIDAENPIITISGQAGGDDSTPTPRHKGGGGLSYTLLLLLFFIYLYRQREKRLGQYNR